MEEFSTLVKMILTPALNETFYMTVLSMILSVILAFILAIILVVTEEKGLKPNKAVYGTLDLIINIFRSVPFIILAVAIIPFTRLIVGTSVGE